MIIDWLNTTLSTPSPSSSPSRNAAGLAGNYQYGQHGSSMSIPELVVEAPADDFGPTKGTSQMGRTTLTLNARTTRDKVSQIDLASLSRRFGSMAGRAGLVSEESTWDLGKMADD